MVVAVCMHMTHLGSLEELIGLDDHMVDEWPTFAQCLKWHYMHLFLGSPAGLAPTLKECSEHHYNIMCMYC